MKIKTLPVIICLACILFKVFSCFGQTTTSWTGVTNTAWATSTNWTGGVPSSTKDVIIGDVSFTGANQPTIGGAAATAKSLTIGGSVASQLSANSALTVNGNININSNGTIISSASISLTGNWMNAGSYTTLSSSMVIFSGAAQTLGGTVPTTFRKLTINSTSTVTLASNITCTGASSLLTVNGTLNPNESPSYLVTSDNLTVNNNATLKVNANIFASNYIITTFSLVAGSTVEYSATATNQTISSSYTYSTLKISGPGTIKSLSADLPALKSTLVVGNIDVLSGTFDMSTFLANRGTTVTGGTLKVFDGAFLKIGGTNSFPSNYTTNTLTLNKYGRI